MTPKRLHDELRASVRGFSSRAESQGLRALIEDTGAENCLTGLLFVQLHTRGYAISRECPSRKHRRADIVVHARSDIYRSQATAFERCLPVCSTEYGE
jgi:hypothetical protein